MEGTDNTLTDVLEEALVEVGVNAEDTMTFRPEYSKVERLMVAIYAYGKQEEEFRAKVRATMMLRRYPDTETAYANDDGHLEGIWVKIKRLSSAIEKELKIGL